MIDPIKNKNLDKPSPVQYEQPIIKFRSTASMYFLLKLEPWLDLLENHWLLLKNSLDPVLIKLRNHFLSQ